MPEDRTSISQATSHSEIGEFWDTHDLADYWDRTSPADFEVDPVSTTTYYALEQGLAARLRSEAERRGVSAETLLNLWVQEKVGEEATPSPDAAAV